MRLDSRKHIYDTWYMELSFTLWSGKLVEPKFGGYSLEENGILQCMW